MIQNKILKDYIKRLKIMINVAVIGLGIGAKHLEAFDLNSNTKIKYVIEKSQKKINFYRKKYPNVIFSKDENIIYKDKDINIISIASYDQHHYQQVLKCIKNKKNIYVEKPICLSMSQLKNIEKQYLKNPVFIGSNLVLRTEKVFKYLRKKVKTYKKRNELINLDAEYIWGRKNKLYGWRSKLKNYSLILGASIHMIDLICWFMNEYPSHVQSFGNNIGINSKKFKKKSFVLTILKFKNNLTFKVSANAVSAHEHFHSLNIFTKNKVYRNTLSGLYEIDKFKNKKINFSYPDKKNRKELINSFIKIVKKNNFSKKEKLDEFYKISKIMKICLFAEKSLNGNKLLKVKY